MKKILVYIFLIFTCYSISSGEFNPWNLDITQRVIHRKNVSHILVDPRVDHFRVVLILGDRFPYSYKSRQYGLFIKVTSEEEAYKLLKSFDEQLDSGREIFLKLNGSRIMEWNFG